MASISGINQSLAFLYHAMSIPVIFGEKMKREHGITSVDELLSQRLTLFELVGEKISTDASRLLASVDYILERQSCRDYHTLKKLFTCNEALKDSFEYFITRSVKTKGLCTERKLDVLPKAIFHPVGKAKKSRCNLPWVKEDNSAWKGIVVDRGDAEAMDKSSLLKHLGIDGSDSAWKLDDDLRMVFLSALPDEIRLPTALFRKLYKHQRDGIQWMSELKIEQMGGILGE